MFKPSSGQLVVLIWCVALGLSVWRFWPPALAADDSGHFAGAHARQTLAALLPDERPHPIGSAAQVEVRARVEAELEQLGLAPRTQSAWACSGSGQCALVHNIIAVIPGAREQAVAFVAHTDSALAGPGAGDDGHAVAVLLELARHIQRGTVSPKNTVVLLFTDGEEAGLLGARAFVEHDPLADQVAVAVNLEARGNAGLSMLFQTLGDSAWLMDAYAAHARSPHCSSFAQPVYEFMPNATDLSALHEGGIPGVDLAFTDGEAAYHSPLDTVEALAPGSLQSQGDNALAMLRGLGQVDLSSPPAGHAVWFDVLGSFVVRAPRASVVPLGLALWLACAGFTVLGWRRAWISAGAVARASGLILGSLVAASALGLGLCAALVVLTGESTPWSAHPWPLSIALVGLGPATSLVALRWARAEALELLLATSLITSALGLVLAWFAAGAAYVALVPALVAAAAALGLWPDVRERAPLVSKWGSVAVGSVALILWLPLLHSLRVALGPGPHLSLCAAIATLWMWPLCADTRPATAWVLAGAVALAGLSPLVLEPYSDEVPRRQWLTMVAEGGEVDVLRGPGPAYDARLDIGGELVSAEELATIDASIHALSTSQAPVADVRARGRDRVTVQLRSRRGAPTLVVSIPEAAGLRGLRVGQAEVSVDYIREQRDVRVKIHAVPPEGVELEAELGDPSAPWRVADRLAWPDAPSQLRAADARTSWDGDTTWQVTELRL